ncbi:MAG: MaoC/PaaZ C-terminal domain-containing protein [Pseudomonadales bacterium]
MRYLEDLEVGQETIFDDEYLVTEEEIIEVGERWDPQPFHIDPVAAKESIFGGLVASSAHIFSIWTSLGHKEIDKEKNIKAVSALGFNHLQWHQPVRPGDVLKSKFTIQSVRESSSRPALGVVTNTSEVFNQNGEKVFTLEVSFLTQKRNP